MLSWNFYNDDNDDKIVNGDTEELRWSIRLIPAG